MLPKTVVDSDRPIAPLATGCADERSIRSRLQSLGSDVGVGNHTMQMDVERTQERVAMRIDLPKAFEKYT